MIKPIITNIKELRKPCELVQQGEDVSQIITDLKDTLASKKGLGLTANQIGYNKAISYLKIPKKINPKTKEIEYSEIILINGKIIEKDRAIKVNGESCLSFPGISVITKRYVFITVEYLDEQLKLKTAMFQDLESVAIQHELDHQQGKILFDKKWRAK